MDSNILNEEEVKRLSEIILQSQTQNNTSLDAATAATNDDNDNDATELSTGRLLRNMLAVTAIKRRRNEDKDSSEIEVTRAGIVIYSNCEYKIIKVILIFMYYLYVMLYFLINSKNVNIYIQNCNSVTKNMTCRIYIIYDHWRNSTHMQDMFTKSFRM